MTADERLALIDRIIDHARPDMMRDWATAWLEALSDEVLDEVRGYLVPTPDPDAPHIIPEDFAV